VREKLIDVQRSKYNIRENQNKLQRSKHESVTESVMGRSSVGEDVVGKHKIKKTNKMGEGDNKGGSRQINLRENPQNKGGQVNEGARMPQDERGQELTKSKKAM